MNQDQYHNDEMKRLDNQLLAIERSPLADRREAMKDYADMMQDSALVGERVEWILGGSYGYGAMMRARDIAKRPRMNRVAALSMLIAALDHNCPSAFARKAYLAQSDSVRAAVDNAILLAINDHLTVMEDSAA